MKTKIKCGFDTTPDELIRREINFFGKSNTNNLQFDMDGFLFLKNFIEVNKFKELPPNEKGVIFYQKRTENYTHKPIEPQVPNSFARYNHPKYKELQNEIRMKVEKIVGKKLYNTYYFDRFYSPGQELKVHMDRDSCEISVSLHLSSNLKTPWEFGIKTPIQFERKNKNIIINDFGIERYFNFNPGDAILYKGCERPHWRNPMPGKKRSILRKIFKMNDFYYHQIFFHYVLSDGNLAHHAYDSISINAYDNPQPEQ